MMEFSATAILMVFAAGLSSVLSPCVLPVIPIVITGTENDSRWRPLFIVGGLSFTFILMGVASSVLGGFITSKIFFLERFAAALIILFGALLIVDLNLAKYLTFFNRFQRAGERKSGNIAALAAGMTLGLVWIPCVGGQLGAVLAMIASGAEASQTGAIALGVILMLVYSAGFAVPLLIAAYASQFFRSKAGTLMKAPQLIRIASGLLLIGFGVFIWTQGMLVFQLM